MGAFGYEVENGQHFLLGDHPDDFAAACVRLIKNLALGLRISENIRDKFEELDLGFHWSVSL